MPILSLSLTLDRIHLGPVGHPSCPHCEDPLDLHQPDSAQPDRLLGTCPDCRAWFLIAPQARLMVRLPDHDTLRDT
jgi:hypothetical protein